MNKLRKLLFTFLSFTTCIAISSAAIVSKDTLFFKTNAMPKVYSLTLDANTPGIPNWTTGEGSFSIKTSDGNSISFRFKGFGRDGNKIYLDDRTGYLYNTTPINKIDSIDINQNGLLISHISYGFYNVYSDWTPDYQIIGNIIYGVENETIQGYTRTWEAPKNKPVNVFRMQQVSGLSALNLSSIVIHYTCG